MAQVSYLRRPVGIAREQLRELLPLKERELGRALSFTYYSSINL